MGKFLGQGSNLCHSSNPTHSSDNARSLTCWATREHLLLCSWSWEGPGGQCGWLRATHPHCGKNEEMKTLLGVDLEHQLPMWWRDEPATRAGVVMEKERAGGENGFDQREGGARLRDPNPNGLHGALYPPPTKTPSSVGGLLFFFFSPSFLSFSSLSLRFTKDPCMGHLFQNFCPDL